MTLPDGPTADELEHLVLMATCAPSVHNTQPWKFVPAPDGFVVRADHSRQLAVSDPYSRDLLLSCGTALHHLVVAGRAIGLDTELELFPVDTDPDSVAQVRFRRAGPATPDQVEAAVAILHRHTHRGRFPDENVSPALIDQLRTAVESQGAMLRTIRPEELVEVEVIVSSAERSLLATDGYTDELEQWVWRAAEEERADGLPPAAIDHGPGRAESLQGRQFGGAVLPRPAEPPAPEHPTVVLLTTLADEPLDWLRAGQALSALLLVATEHGALAQPLGQVVDVPATRWALQRLLGTVGIPQMLLRLGVGEAAAVSPRRPVADVYSPARN